MVSVLKNSLLLGLTATRSRPFLEVSD